MSSSTRSRTRSKGGLTFEHDVSGDGDRRRITINQRADPSDTGDRLEPAEPGGLAYDDVPTAPTLPGTGAEYDSCGVDFHGLFCDRPHCLETHEVGQTCRRSTCPRCWKAWAFHRGRKQVAKLETLRNRRQSEQSGWQKFHHITVSFRPDVRVRSDDPVKRLRKVAQALLDQVNVDNGLAVFHNYRIKEEYRGEVLGHDSGNGDMTWKDVLEMAEGDDWPAEAIYDEFLEYAPHFHVFAVSEFVQGGAVTDAIDDQTGVVIHRIADDSGTSLETIDDLAAAGMYSLSHAALEQRDDGSYRARYQAFGALANESPADWALGKADDACRKAAPDVLGLSIAKPECDAPADPEPADDADPEPAAEPEPDRATATAAASTPTAPPTRSTALPSSPSSTDLPSRDAEWDSGANTGFDADADSVRSTIAVQEATAATTPTADERERCGATLRPIRLAGAVLDDDDVREQADPDALENLQQRYDEYVALGKPEPETEPLDDPPTDASPAD